MADLWRIFSWLWKQERRVMLGGMLLALAVPMMGFALLGISGWFVVASAGAGLAGVGIAFDVFRPSAAIRFLALARTGARYGERLQTHDATLRALSRLRLHLLARYCAAPFSTLRKMRAARTLNRITSDTNALDALPIRLIFPLTSALGALSLAGWLIGWLVDLRLALVLGLGLGFGSGAALVLLARRCLAPARRFLRYEQRLRENAIEALRTRTLLTMSGALRGALLQSLRAGARAQAQQDHLARAEIRAGLMLAVLGALTGAVMLGLGGWLVVEGHITAAQAAFAFFGSVALAEILPPLRRGLGELGRIHEAARRVAPHLAEPEAPPETPQCPSHSALPAAPLDLVIANPCVAPREGRVPPLHIRLEAGECAALTGRSGCGKSTLLNAISGLQPLESGEIILGQRPLAQWEEGALRSVLGYLPQRPALMSGSLRESLLLSAPEASDENISKILKSLHLSDLLDRLGGLDGHLGEGGLGLSGGEARRLALARVVLRAPAVLLLDEPTEGLDSPTATAVLQAIRAHLPNALILLAAHRPEERTFATRIITLPEEYAERSV